MCRLLHYSVISLLAVCFSVNVLANEDWGLVGDADAKNEALIVGVLHGLPGGNHNTANMQEITSNPAYKFHNVLLTERKAGSSAVLSQLTQSAANVDAHGTLLFYFGGHGGDQILWLQDRNVRTREFRKAIEAGRETLGPLSRLVMIIDACHAASNINPLIDPGARFLSSPVQFQEPLTAESVAEEFGGERGSTYWDQLIVLTSSRADELSWAGSEGHMFTVALHKAFKNALEENKTIGEFAHDTAKNLTASHAIYKLIPDTLADEKMRP